MSFNCLSADEKMWDDYQQIGYLQLNGLVDSDFERLYDLKQLHNHVLECDICRLRAERMLNLASPTWPELEAKYRANRDSYITEFKLINGDFRSGRVVFSLFLCGEIMLYFHPLLIAREFPEKVKIWSDSEDIDGLNAHWSKWLRENYMIQIKNLFEQEITVAKINLNWKNAIQYIAFCWGRYEVALSMLTVLAEGEEKEKLKQKINVCQRIDAGEIFNFGERLTEEAKALVLV